MKITTAPQDIPDELLIESLGRFEKWEMSCDNGRMEFGCRVWLGGLVSPWAWSKTSIGHAVFCAVLQFGGGL